jgi:hypothetical protein
MSAPCPHCGGLQDADTPIRRGLWLIGPAEAFRESEKAPISRAACRTFYAIARANGQPITHHDVPGCGEGTFAHHLREIRKALGERFPLRGIGNRGFAWAAGA